MSPSLRALVGKELTSIRPFVALLLVMCMLAIAEAAGSDVAHWYNDAIRSSANELVSEAAFILVLAFILGAGLLTREQDEGTLAFLDGLPIERRTVFLTKLAVGALCMFAFALFSPALAWLTQVLLHWSVDVPITVGSVAALTLRYAVLSLLGVALGMLCGLTRQLSWPLLLLLAALVGILNKAWPRLGAAVDPTMLIADGWATHGLGGVGMSTCIGITLACIGLSYLVFASAGGARMQRLAALVARRAVVVSVYVLAIVALIVVAGFMVSDQMRAGYEEGQAEAAARHADPAPHTAKTTLDTRHYRFTGAGVAGMDAVRAEQAFSAAAAALALPPDGLDMERIDVDLSGSIAHTAGIASYQRIRMGMDENWYEVLVHETVHVLAAALAGGERDRELAKLSLFNEGLAYWAEPARRASAALRASDELAAATVARRRLIQPDSLLEEGAVEAQLDLQMRYPLGSLLVQALVARYGPAAPAHLLRTVARGDFPRDLQGFALYRSSFQLAGFDLNLVLFDHALRLKQLGEQYAGVIDALPRPRGVLVKEDQRVGIVLQVDRPLAAGQRLVVRFRPKESATVDEYTIVARLARIGAKPVAWLPLAKVAGNKVCFQAGVRMAPATQVGVDDEPLTVYEPWTCLPLDAASAPAGLQMP